MPLELKPERRAKLARYHPPPQKKEHPQKHSMNHQKLTEKKIFEQ